MIPLNITTAYSLMKSSLRLEHLTQMEVPAAAVADEGVVYAYEKFQSEMQKAQKKPLFALKLKLKIEAQAIFPFLLIARTQEGYQSLLSLSTLWKKDEDIGLSWQKFMSQAEDLFVIARVQDPQFAHFMQNYSIEQLQNFFKLLTEKFGHENVLLGIENPKEYREQAAYFSQFLLDEVAIPLFNHNQVEERQNLAVLSAIENRTTLAELKEKSSQKKSYPLAELSQISKEFEEAGLSQAIKKTYHIAEACKAGVPMKAASLPHFKTPLEQSSLDYLRELTEQRLKEVGQFEDENYKARLDHELKVISDMGFPDYFLIVWDIIRYAKSKNILTGPGRGSAAGSLVAYLLQITTVDPLEYHLIFERFLNPNRSSPPDIDLDFPDDRRQDIIYYIQRKYGTSHVAQIITFGTFGARQAIRDAGRVLGLERSQQDEWAKLIPNQPGITLLKAYEESRGLQGKVKSNPQNERLFKIATQIEGLPRNASTHASGIIISKSPLLESVALQVGARELHQTQFEMGSLEAMGMLKFDILGLRNLATISEVMEYIHKIEPDFSIEKVSRDDKKTFEVFKQADTLGIFQFESAGMRRFLQQLQPSTFEDIVAAMSLFRPGPMGEISTYINRKNGLEQVHYLHESIADILSLTYGIIIYQEQIMQIVSRMGGFTLAEADILRRAVSKKDEALIKEQRAHFVAGATSQGYSAQDAEVVYDAIERFADYGFNRSHAVAYSKIAYLLAYLKAHHPKAFYAAQLNSDTRQKIPAYIQEMSIKNIRFLRPSVLKSQLNYTAEADGVRLGISQIKTLAKHFQKELLVQREKNDWKNMIDVLKSLDDKNRTEENVEKVIYSGLFDDFKESRGTLLASLEQILSNLKSGSLTSILGAIFEPVFVEGEELDENTRIIKEVEYLSPHVPDHPAWKYQNVKNQWITSLKEGDHTQLVVYLHDKRVIQTKNGDDMAFVTVTDGTGEISLTLFPEPYRESLKWLLPGKMLLVYGKAEKDRKNGGLNLIVNKIQPAQKIQKPKTLYLQMDSVENDAAKNFILQMIKKYPGQDQVIIHGKQEKRTIQLKAPWLIQAVPEVLKVLREYLGSENVVVRLSQHED